MIEKLQHYSKVLKGHLFKSAISYLVHPLFRLLFWTCKVKVRGLNEYFAIANKEKCMLLIWHDQLTMLPSLLLRLSPDVHFGALISNSRDGDLIAIISKKFKSLKPIRVAHDSKHLGLKNMIKELKNKLMVIVTPDGPRGPRYEIKKGAFFSIRVSKSKVVLLKWKADKFWQLKTWDKMMIPKPFSKIEISFKVCQAAPKNLEELQEALLQHNRQ